MRQFLRIFNRQAAKRFAFENEIREKNKKMQPITFFILK
jgi:hypothetical protein